MADANHSIGEPAVAVQASSPAEDEQLALLDAVLMAIRRYATHLAQALPVTRVAGVRAALPWQSEPPSPLTPKQQQIFRTHIMERLDIHDLVGLVIYALREGLVGLDDYNDSKQPDRLVRSRP